MTRISVKAALLSATVIISALAMLGNAQAAPPTPYVSATPLTVIIPVGQSIGSATVEWNAGAASLDAELWMKIDNDPEARLSGDALGTKSVKIFVDEKLTFNLYKTAARNTLLSSVVITASHPRSNKPPTPSGTPAGGTALDDLALRGGILVGKDPLAAELRSREPNASARRGFDIGMATAEGHTLPGPGKDKMRDSLPSSERSGFSTAVAFSLERNRNAELAATGAAIAEAIPRIAKARTVDEDVFYWLGFDIATGIFGNPALGARGNTATGPGSLKIRDSLSAAGQRGFNAAVKLHLGQDISPAPGKLDPNSPVIFSQSTDVNSGASGVIKEVQKAPFISKVRVQPGAINVIISFASTQNKPPLIEIGKVAPKPDQYGIMAFPIGSGAFSRFLPAGKGKYSLNLDATNDQLDIGTTYYYIINVFNDNKNDTKRRQEQVSGQFTTLPQTVKIVWERILIEDDSDAGSTGEIQWWFWANYNQADAQRGNYYNGDMDSGHNYYPSKTVIMKNAPDHLLLSASGYDDDSQFGGGMLPLESPPLNGPKNLTIGDENVARGEFDLSKYPGTNISVPFSFGSMPHGDLRFVVFGHLEITRPTP